MDGTIAVATLLQDDGYPALELFISYHNDNGNINYHSVFVYNKNGKWGSAGINLSDLKDTNYNTLEDLASELANNYSSKLDYYNLNELSQLNLSKMTDTDKIITRYFLKESKIVGSPKVDYKLPKKTETGFTVNKLENEIRDGATYDTSFKNGNLMVTTKTSGILDNKGLITDELVEMTINLQKDGIELPLQFVKINSTFTNGLKYGSHQETTHYPTSLFPHLLFSKTDSTYDTFGYPTSITNEMYRDGIFDYKESCMFTDGKPICK